MARTQIQQITNIVATLTPNIQPKTPQMEAALQAGYPSLTVAKAQLIIDERKKNPALWPYDELVKAQAFLAAYEGVPLEQQVIATRLGPERSQAQME